ncbi:putative Aldehyde dehydrogenase domain-containing protein [Seiridium cardinale]|uniref:Aldehyde dehydrogenase domain-containing protein n=1 Tax=Seiridium cardinale TaxID=138064 RepID=A0ABR2Y9Y9_9PEZI
MQIWMLLWKAPRTANTAARVKHGFSIVDIFTAKLVAKVAAVRMGPGPDSSTTQGPLVNKAAILKVTQHIVDATQKEAKTAVGGKESQNAGFFLSPLFSLA